MYKNDTDMRKLLSLMTDEKIYIGPSQYYNNIVRAKKFIKNPIDIYEGFGMGSGPRYMINLLDDYETYIKDFGYVSINDFLKGWTIVVPEDYAIIDDIDTLYVCNGGKMMQSVVVSEKQRVHEEKYQYYEIEVWHYDRYGNIIDGSDEMLMEGDLYYIPFIHIDYFYKSPKKRGQEGDVLCPILITGTKKQ